jgi:hypothetical protein
VSAPDDPRLMRISVQGSELAAVFTLDDPPPMRTGGMDGWTEQARGRRRALLVFDGPGAVGQDINVALDAFGEDRDQRLPSVRRQWQVLRALWSLPHPGSPPPLATLAGKLVWGANEQDETSDWALRGMTASEQRHDNQTGELVRWIGTLSFSQRAASEIVRITGAPNAGARIHVVKTGETLASIARAEKVKATDITRANGDKIRDPRRVKVGDRLRLPKGKP